MARRFRVRFKKKINVPRVVAKLVGVIIALYVGNEIINEVGGVLNGSTGPFNVGFKLIGWCVGTSGSCSAGTACASATEICGTTGSGVLTVVGIVGIASIIMEFVNFSL